MTAAASALQELVVAQREYDEAISQLDAARREARDPAAVHALEDSGKLVAQSKAAMLDAAQRLADTVARLDESQLAFTRALDALAIARDLASQNPAFSRTALALARTESAVASANERLRIAGRLLRDARMRSE